MRQYLTRTVSNHNHPLMGECVERWALPCPGRSPSGKGTAHHLGSGSTAQPHLWPCRKATYPSCAPTGSFPSMATLCGGDSSGPQGKPWGWMPCKGGIPAVTDAGRYLHKHRAAVPGAFRQSTLNRHHRGRAGGSSGPAFASFPRATPRLSLTVGLCSVRQWG